MNSTDYFATAIVDQLLLNFGEISAIIYYFTCKITKLSWRRNFWCIISRYEAREIVRIKKKKALVNYFLISFVTI